MPDLSLIILVMVTIKAKLNTFGQLSIFKMIKNLCLVVVLLLSFAGAQAQVYLGFQGGVNASKMSFTNNVDYNFIEIGYERGFIGGLVFQYLGDKHAGLQIEGNYSQRGWVVNDTTSGNVTDTINRMNYIEMPILTHINIGSGKLRGLFQLGPYLGYALNRETTVRNTDTGAEETQSYEFDNDKDGRVDFGLITGAGFEYRLPFGKFAVEARYLIGLGDVDKVKSTQSEVSQFRVACILVRFTVPLRKENPTPTINPQQ